MSLGYDKEDVIIANLVMLLNLVMRRLQSLERFTQELFLSMDLELVM